MSKDIEIEDFVIRREVTDSLKKGKVRTRYHFNVPFLKGPIPLLWLVKAQRLGRSALSVGLILWYRDGIREIKSFRVGKRDIAKLLGITERSVLRGISKLEAANLIFVSREAGHKLIVTLNKSPAAWETKGENNER